MNSFFPYLGLKIHVQLLCDPKCIEYYNDQKSQKQNKSRTEESNKQANRKTKTKKVRWAADFFPSLFSFSKQNVTSFFNAPASNAEASSTTELSLL